MKPIQLFLLSSAITLLITGCRTKAPCPDTEDIPESSQEHLVADTIIYDVVIRNINPYDTWATESLQGLNREWLIDSLFALVYDEQALAFDYFDGTPLSPRKVKKLEKEEWFSRNRIGKIQFVEKWYFNKAARKMSKEVISVALGHELYGDSGEFRGYKPIFKLQLQTMEK